MHALNDRQISAALSIIHRQAEQEWTLEGLSKNVGISRTMFANRFRDTVGVTPMQYLADWRMLKARELLQTGNLPIFAVAERVGYRSEEAFNRAFKKKYKITPGVFRRVHQTVVL